MIKLLTLRNIISLYILLFLVVSCTKPNRNNSSIGEVKTYSSEDKNDIPTAVGEIRNPETGDIIYVVQK